MTLRNARGKTEASLERDDVLLFNNVLNEVCNGFTLSDFDSSIGAAENQVRDLFGRIQRLEAMRPVRLSLIHI